MKQTKINSISIVLPCYNSQKFIYDTLVSINNQDYNGPLELVCIDDGSTDNTLQIVKKFKFNNKIELVLISRKNKGFLYSILEGVEKVKGIHSTYWFRWYLVTKSFKCFNELFQKKSVVLVGSKPILIDEYGHIIGEEKTKKNPVFFLMKDNVICHSSIIFNKTAYLLTRGGYANDLKLNEHFADYFLYIKLAQIGDVINHNEFPTLYYRVLSNNMSIKDHILCIFE